VSSSNDSGSFGRSVVSVHHALSVNNTFTVARHSAESRAATRRYSTVKAIAADAARSRAATGVAMHAPAAALLAQLARGQQSARVYLSLGKWSASWLAACSTRDCCAAQVAHPASERPMPAPPSLRCCHLVRRSGEGGRHKCTKFDDPAGS
jgi:hypothetical protein